MDWGLEDTEEGYENELAFEVVADEVDGVYESCSSVSIRLLDCKADAGNRLAGKEGRERGVGVSGLDTRHASRGSYWKGGEGGSALRAVIQEAAAAESMSLEDWDPWPDPDVRLLPLRCDCPAMVVVASGSGELPGESELAICDKPDYARLTLLSTASCSSAVVSTQTSCGSPPSQPPSSLLCFFPTETRMLCTRNERMNDMR